MPRGDPQLSKRPSTQRRLDLADAIEYLDQRAMVACSNCAQSGEICYFSGQRSKKCSCCLRKNADCDGSFSLDEFRRVVDERKAFEQRSRRKRKEMARLRRALAEVESEDNELQDSIARLEVISSNMLRREMQALGVLEEQSEAGMGAFAEPEGPWSEVLFNQTIDWEEVLASSSFVPPVVPEATGVGDDSHL